MSTSLINSVVLLCIVTYMPDARSQVPGLIPLSKNGMELRSEVEKLYGQPLLLELVDSTDPYYGGQSDVLDDGTPRIRVNRQSKSPATTLIHELNHLVWRSRGVPTLYIPASPSDVQLNDSTLKYLQQLFTEVRERIAHTMFFEEMRNLGYDPSEQIRSFMTHALDSGEIDGVSDSAAQTNLLLQAILEANDPELVRRIETRFQRLGTTAPIAQARRLADLIRRRAPTTGQTAVDLLVEVVNELLGGKGRVKFAQWSDERRGPWFVDRGAVILVLPPG